MSLERPLVISSEDSPWEANTKYILKHRLAVSSDCIADLSFLSFQDSQVHPRNCRGLCISKKVNRNLFDLSDEIFQVESQPRARGVDGPMTRGT